jgi:hypothetical protein
MLEGTVCHSEEYYEPEWKLLPQQQIGVFCVGYVLFTTVDIALVLIKITSVIVKTEWPVDGTLQSVNKCDGKTNEEHGCVISDFRRDVDEICALLGYYATLGGTSVRTFRGNLSVPSSMVKKSKKTWPLKMGPIGCPEASM